MKKLLRVIPILMGAYFIFIHPAFIYYSIPSDNTTYEPIYFYISIGLWSLIFIALLWNIYQVTFQSKVYLQRIVREGVRMEGKIISSKTKKVYPDKSEDKVLLIELSNLKQETIRHQMHFCDSKPWERKYEEGNKVPLRIDSELKHYQVIVLEDTKARVNYRLYLIWALFVVVIATYYYFVFQKEGRGLDWSFMGPWHPSLISAYALIVITLIISLFNSKFFYRLSRKKQVELKFKGRKTLARVTEVAETGTRINNQPVFKFTIEFSDAAGRVIQVVKKNIVPLSKLSNLQVHSRVIFYLEENPHQCEFEEDLLESA